MNKHALLFSGLLFLFLSACTSTSQEVVKLSATSGEELKEAGWETEYWSNQKDYGDTLSAKGDTRILTVTSDTLVRDRWYKKINIRPYGRYKVTGYIKTVNLVGEKNTAGAGFRLGKFEIEGDTTFTGDTDWTRVELFFDSEGDDSVLLECLLGKNGPASGKVYFDNLSIEELSAKELKPEVTLDLSQEKEPMSPYLYGQFIEQMGKCIYGGIWAEMIQDRKFYHLPGTKASPWSIATDTMAIRVDSSHLHSRGNLPVFQLEGQQELSQEGLSTLAGKEYEGRIVFKPSLGIKQVQITFAEETKVWDITNADYQSIPFSFLAKADTNNARLTIAFSGKGTVILVATSLMPADHVEGFRPDVLALLKELNAPVYRWPGGNFVSGYDWKDGIGDPDKRPTRYERAWNGLEYNDVGLHEFMKLCELLDTEPFIAVNTGLGTAKMAAEEVEYMNGDATTPMGKLRAQNGTPTPYQVQLWAVGNEMFGAWQLGHMPVEDYVKKHNEVAQAMKAVDPEIELVAVGFPGDWNDQMYTHCQDNMTYFSEHFYRQDWHAGGLLTHVKQIPEVIAEIADEHRRCRIEIPGVAEKNIKIALDEWNFWYGPHVYGLLGTRYFVRDALGIAAGFNEFSRQSDIYYMANYAQTVNVIGAIKTTPTSSWLESTGLILKMYRQHFGSRPIDLEGDMAPLDVAATLTEDGQYCTISVINATRQDYQLSISDLSNRLAKEGELYLLSAKDDMAYNDAENPERISISEQRISIKNGQLNIPAVSAGIYKFSVTLEELSKRTK